LATLVSAVAAWADAAAVARMAQIASASRAGNSRGIKLKIVSPRFVAGARLSVDGPPLRDRP
jgi:hypothetical protein